VVRPNVIVNAAAYTTVDRAESEPEQAYRINAAAPEVLADEAEKIGAWLVHYSTDYVFDGGGDRPWRETDATGPLNIYGASKLQGEEAVRGSGCRHLIFRTSWVYAARGHNFIKTILRLGRERERLEIVDDQIGSPTGAELLADVTAHAIRFAMQRPEASGLYHVAAAGEVSWRGYGQFLITLARTLGADIKVPSDAIIPIASEAFPTPASRPKNSRLDTAKFLGTFQVHLPHWQTGVARVLTEILEKPS
jgi:dTDP-4-dehydrorhamnose reductase